MELWTFIKQLKSEDLIHEFERTVSFTFSKDFVDFVKQYNGSYAELPMFDTKISKERDIHRFYSFNHEDASNIWTANRYRDVGQPKDMIYFATSCCGNQIGFDKRTGHVVFYDHESGKIEPVADTFTEFLNCLYSDEDL